MPRATAARRKTTSSLSGPTKGRKLLTEITGLYLLCLGAGVALALFSYDPGDPSWRRAVPAGEVNNWLGQFGSYTASFLYQWLGWAAPLVPISLFVLALSWLREPRMRPSGLKPLGLLLLFLSLTGLLALAEPATGAFHWGGVVGYVITNPEYGLAHYLNKVGAFVALGAAGLTGLLLTTRFSLVALLVRLTPREREAGVAAALGERFRQWRQQRAAARVQLEIATRREPPPAVARKPEPLLVPRAAEEARKLTPPPAPQMRKPRNLEPLSAPAAAPPPREEFEITPLVRAAEPAKKPAEKAPEQPVAARAQASSGTTASVAAPPPPPARTATPAMPPPTNGRHAPAPPPAEERVVEEDELPGGPEGADDFDDEAAAGQRSVAEMLATASVKRAVLAEEKPRPAPAPRNVLRTAPDYKLPASDMLTAAAPRPELADADLMERAHQLAEKCSEFNVSGQVKQISPGPVVTTFEFKPDPGVKYSRVTSLVDDLCLGLKAESIRIDRIPGKSTVGIEVPNDRREVIRLREVVESQKFRDSDSKLTLALGKTIDGANYVADLARMPHLLIAGATGAGKSVALNSILVSLLYKATPEEVKMILVDPKRLELGLYADIPHLLTPIVTDPKRASYSLKWAVAEMETRYKHLAAFGVRNIDQYNQEVCPTVDRNLAEDSEELPKPLPYIIVVIDELADLMMVSARDVEESITRLAQMARAVGIHLVLATQRPSVDVITGLIKANFPSRISFRVSSKVDSRTIIDTNGAEALLGQGDMLFLPPGTSRLVRVHGAYVDEKEVKRIADFVRAQGRPAYDDKITMSEKEIEGDELADLKKDEKYDEALRIVIEMGRASTSVLQRRLRIGYGRAASIIDMMYREGVVGPEDGSKPRQVLVKADFLDRLDQMREEEG